MITLILKDMRQTLPILVGTILVPVIILIVILVVIFFGGQANHRAVDQAELGSWVLSVWVPPSLFISLFCFSILGSCLLASERQDKSISFLATLPISRTAILSSKLIVLSLQMLLVATFAAITLPNLSVSHILTPEPLLSCLHLFKYAILGGGSGWLASTLFRSSTYAVGISFLTMFAALMWESYRTGAINEDISYYVSKPTVVILFSGLICFVAGFIIYVKRVEP